MLIRRILIEPSTTCKVASWLLHCCDYRSALNLGKNAPYRPHRPCASQRHDILQVLSPRLLKKAAANSFASAALWMKLNREEADAVLTYAFRTSLGLVVPVTDNSSCFHEKKHVVAVYVAFLQMRFNERDFLLRHFDVTFLGLIPIQPNIYIYIYIYAKYEISFLRQTKSKISVDIPFSQITICSYLPSALSKSPKRKASPNL